MGQYGLIMRIGIRMAKAFFSFVVLLLRTIIDSLPRDTGRALHRIEEQLSFYAEDGEKLLVPGMDVQFAFIGWLVIIGGVVLPVSELVELFFEL